MFQFSHFPINTIAFFLGAAILFYVAFLYRNWLIAKRLRSKSRAVWLKFFWRSAVFLLLLVAFLGPNFGLQSKEIKAEGRDVMIAIDLSESMNATDVVPSRLERAKKLINQLLDALPTDRFGLIIFSDEAFVQCPLTVDQAAFRLFVETLSTQLLSSSGTELIAPLKLGKSKLAASDMSLGENQQKVFLLVSDGEDGGNGAEAIASEFPELGIKLFTLGLGTKSGGTIPNGTNGVKRKADGQKVVTKLKSEVLEDLSKAGSGQYFEINAQLDDTQRLIQTLLTIKTTLRYVKSMDIGANKYYYFLAAAVFMLLADILFTVKIIRI